MSHPPLLIAHRGARSTKSVLENTMMSFDLALEHGCNGIEFDLRQTSDGRSVICHDPRIGKIAVAKATSRQLLHLPTLEDVLRHYGHQVFLDIEIKVKGMESSVLAALRQRDRRENYVISSFLPEVVMELKARSAAVCVGIICEKSSQLMQWRALPVKYVIVHHSLLTSKLVRTVHDAGRQIMVWTVNDKRSMRRFAGWGVDGIISDETRLLAETQA